MVFSLKPDANIMDHDHLLRMAECSTNHNVTVLWCRRQVVYVARNPKDVVVSLHHHCRLLQTLDYSGTLEQFIKYFVEDDGKGCVGLIISSMSYFQNTVVSENL